MNGYEWLGIWEPLQAPGKHSSRVPAEGAQGYRYPPAWSGVIRAIPVEGTVSEARPASWEKCPQARYWLKPEKKPLRERILEWLRRPA